MNNNNYTFKELVESIGKPKESEELEEAKLDKETVIAEIQEYYDNLTKAIEKLSKSNENKYSALYKKSRSLGITDELKKLRKIHKYSLIQKIESNLFYI